jgi:hypothetical protein
MVNLINFLRTYTVLVGGEGCLVGIRLRIQTPCLFL